MLTEQLQYQVQQHNIAPVNEARWDEAATQQEQQQLKFVLVRVCVCVCARAHDILDMKIGSMCC